MLKSATQLEEKSEREGKLRQLPLPLGRFARSVDAFKTRTTGGT